MISLIALALALLPAPAAQSAVAPTPACATNAPAQIRHGRVKWFEGTYQELLTEAAEQNRMILLNFYSDRCKFCRVLDAGAYSDDSVVKTLEPVLCYSVDALSDFGAALVTEFPVDDLYPALIFLDSDGSLRDRIIGYKETPVMRPMIERIVADENTLGSLRRAVEAAPKDLEAIWLFAQKLRQLDDTPGFNQQLARIKQLDPEGKSIQLHRISLDTASEASFKAKDTLALRAFLKNETFPENLYKGWCIVAHDELTYAKKALYDGFPKLARQKRLAYHDAHLMAWPHHPKGITAEVGNHIAWDMYIDWQILNEKQRSMAIEIARAASAAAPRSADIIDTLACLLFMDGDIEEASELMRKCIAMAPDYALWQERLEMFQDEES